MRRLFAVSIVAAVAIPVAATATATFAPLCITVESGRGWDWVANQFVPSITGAEREAFKLRIWAYEEETRLKAGELVCIDPNDPALRPTTTTTTGVPTSTTIPSATSTTTTAPATTSSTAPTALATTTTTVAPPPPTSTTPPSSGTIADVPSNFNTAAYLEARVIPESTALEPSGNFRTICRPSHLAQEDPIVNPGATSAHLHLFFGNTAANRNSTYTTLRTTGDSTCEGGPLNRTGYWMPAVFDGTGRVVPPSLIIVYYKATASGGTLAQQQADIASTVPLPNGLRMIAGAPAGGFIWKCGDGTGVGFVIPANCPTGYLIASIEFPDCWDGVNLDSPNHRSHMAYRSYVNGRHLCPASHPVRIPTITEGFHWETGATDVGTWSLSSDLGAVRGSTLHADWFGAWDNPVQARWFRNCDLGMLNSNNGNLCDGQGLRGAIFAGTIPGTARIGGYTPDTRSELMAASKHKAYTAAIVTSLSTELNSLATAANSAASAAIDNGTALDLYYDLTFTVAAQGVARSAGAIVGIYMVMALDGTNYDDVNHETAELVAVFSLDAAVTLRQATRRDIPVPPGLFKLFARNQTGQAFAASGNLLEYRAHSIETV